MVSDELGMEYLRRSDQERLANTFKLLTEHHTTCH